MNTILEFKSLKLFWGKYPYKAEVGVSNASFRNSWWIETYRTKIEELLPVDKTTWKIARHHSNFHVYFTKEVDLDNFCNQWQDPRQRNYIKVWKVAFPIFAMKMMLDKNKNSKVQNSLYHGNYRYCVNFRYIQDSRIHVLDEWAKSLYGDSPERGLYSQSVRRRLYVNSDDEIFLAYLGFKNDISSVSTIILRSEIDAS